MKTCTWKDCTAEGVHDQHDKRKKVWATLCQSHHDELDAAVKSMDVKKLLRAWVLANGGAKAMAAKS